MSLESWIVFALFWTVFVTTPGPNAVNCIQNGMTFGFRRALIGVLAIVTQAFGFLLLSAAGVTALIAASETAFALAQFAGAAALIFLGVRGWMNAGRRLAARPTQARSIYLRALAIAVINPKSVAGYLAAFSQFIDSAVPVWSQMGVIMPTALCLTALSYCGYTALGAGIGASALGAVMNLWVRRAMGLCFIIYGLLLGAASSPVLRS